jgi:hypothetical protein
MHLFKKVILRFAAIGLVGASLADAAVARPAAAHVVALNQVGYLSAQPKRFTAPLSPDGSAFNVSLAESSTPLFSGTIIGHVGDFSAFSPADSAHRYVVNVSGKDLAPVTSDPFLVSSGLWLDQFWPAATDFMVDIRSVTGTHPSAYGGGAFRDSTYYAFEGPSMLLLLAANPDRVSAHRRQIDWAADAARVLDPEFAFDAKNPHSDGVLETVRRYYQEFAPPASQAPDLVKLIHWAYGYLLLKPESGDPSGDPLPRQIHSQHVEQFAYLLHSWSQVAPWLSEEFRIRCRDFAFDHWESSGLLKIDPLWSASSYNDPLPAEKPVAGAYLHPFKGRHPPGHSIAPNLMMYEVARREGRSDASRYLAAARSQAQWLVDHLEWSDPRTGKGQRMSEFRTVIGLVWFLQHHPAEAPAGLREKIVAWARIAVNHSQNIWDFRRYDLVEHWSIPRLNEPGNLLGFTAAALAASWVIKDVELCSRLREIAFAQTDAVFGRNPLRAAGVSFAQQGFPEVERGWPIHYKLDTCARLETTRGSISAGCGSEFYPYRPDAAEFRHAEGWVNYNAAWNVALAYVHFDQTGRRP